MVFLASIIRVLAKGFERIGHVFYRLGNLLYGFLPVLLDPPRLHRLLNHYYATTYYAETFPTDRATLETYGFELESWEADVCRRYGIDSGRMLALGCGWGREAILVAERNVKVVGLDRHPGVLKVAQQVAAERKVPAQFLQADLFALPHRPKCFDFAMLSGTMYSAFAGLRRRQAWLRDLSRVLKPGGFIMLSFQMAHPPTPFVDRLSVTLNRFLRTLPGANADYQVGDVCHGGHFFHLFQEERELREELEGAGAVVHELSWPQQYAVISYPLQ